VTTRLTAAYVQRVREYSFAAALLAGIIGLTACGSGSPQKNDVAAGPKPSQISRDCFDAWNAPANQRNQSAVAGRFTVARVANWVMQASGGVSDGPSSDQSQGCGYLFHTSDRYLSISGAWEGRTLRWGIPPTIQGSWSAEQQAAGEDNARVDPEGRLSEE
jgi:hypothetical protein